MQNTKIFYFIYQNVKIISSCCTSKYRQTISSSRIIWWRNWTFQAHPDAVCYWESIQVSVQSKSLDKREWCPISLCALGTVWVSLELFILEFGYFSVKVSVILMPQDICWSCWSDCRHEADLIFSSYNF